MVLAYFCLKNGFEVTIDLDLQLKVIIFAYFGLKVSLKQQFP